MKVKLFTVSLPIVLAALLLACLSWVFLEPTIAMTTSQTASAQMTAREGIGNTFVLTPTKDNTLYQDNMGALSNGAGAHLFAGTNSGGQIRRGVLAFDMAGTIPAGATIVNVTLELNMSRSIAGAEDVSLHRLEADWGQGTSDAAANEGSGAASTSEDATWLHTFFDTNSWANPGGDFAAEASATQSIGAVASYQWSSTQMISDVQSWLDNPESNVGWLLMGNEQGNGSAKRFDSRENSTAENRPTLTIVIEQEPTALSLRDLNVQGQPAAAFLPWLGLLLALGLASTSLLIQSHLLTAWATHKEHENGQNGGQDS